ncbi:MAG: hypothetical protein HONBIEJF_02890 [Fimbriimonadaceae bacterium]|nr:hypothetical protein [Fimbriimonadaceae bacterium]
MRRNITTLCLCVLAGAASAQTVFDDGTVFSLGQGAAQGPITRYGDWRLERSRGGYADHSNWRQHGRPDILQTMRAYGGTYAPANQLEIDAMQQLVANNQPPRPRMLGTQARFNEIKQLLNTDTTLQGYQTFLVNRANNMKTMRLAIYRNDASILSEARYAADVIMTCAYVYRTTGDLGAATRAKNEMINVASWPSWYPQTNTFHFVSECAMATAIGQDWLYDVMSPADKTAVVNALSNKALVPALDQLRAADPLMWWQWSGLNITLVSNAGLVMAALAVGDTDSGLAGEVLAHCLKSIRLALDSYKGGGGWIEGHGYWDYATLHLAYISQSLSNTLGTDFALSAAEGLESTGDYKLFMGGRSEIVYNFANVGTNNVATPVLMWLANKFNKPEYAVYQRQRIAARRPQPMDMLWYTPAGTENDLFTMPKNKKFDGVDQMFMRSTWEDNNGISVAFKGGDNSANHNQPDLGTFCLDWNGERWANDTGMTSDQPRDDVYRGRTEGQNTLTLDKVDQQKFAEGKIVNFNADSNKPFAVTEQSTANGNKSTLWQRGIMLVGDKYVVLQDEIKAERGTVVEWGMHTYATLDVNYRTATLTLNGKVMKAYIRNPRNARFSVGTINTDLGESPLTGMNKLVINYKSPKTTTRLSVVFIPQKEGAPKHTSVRVWPLKDWLKVSNKP